MKGQLIAIASTVSLALAVTAVAQTPAGLVVLHGKIHTEDDKRGVAQAMALRGNTIVARHRSGHGRPGRTAYADGRSWRPDRFTGHHRRACPLRGDLKVATWKCRVVQAGADPAPVTASHGPGIEPCRYRGNAMLDA
jgi:hypothetical protein